jgi:hypothetical protein
VFGFQVPKRAIKRVPSSAGWEQFRQFIAIQIDYVRNAPDLRQNGLGTLVVPCNRHSFALSCVLSITRSDCYDRGFRAAAARDPERMIQRKDFFPGFDFQTGE